MIGLPVAPEDFAALRVGHPVEIRHRDCTVDLGRGGRLVFEPVREVGVSPRIYAAHFTCPCGRAWRAERIAKTSTAELTALFYRDPP